MAGMSITVCWRYAPLSSKVVADVAEHGHVLAEQIDLDHAVKVKDAELAEFALRRRGWPIARPSPRR